MQRSQQTVLALISISVLLTYAHEVVSDSESLSIRPLAGGLIVAVFLVMAAQPAPRLATAFAVVIFIAAITNTGETVLEAVAP